MEHEGQICIEVVSRRSGSRGGFCCLKSTLGNPVHKKNEKKTGTALRMDGTFGPQCKIITFMNFIWAPFFFLLLFCEFRFENVILLNLKVDATYTYDQRFEVKKKIKALVFVSYFIYLLVKIWNYFSTVKERQMMRLRLRRWAHGLCWWLIDNGRRDGSKPTLLNPS